MGHDVVATRFPLDDHRRYVLGPVVVHRRLRLRGMTERLCQDREHDRFELTRF